MTYTGFRRAFTVLELSIALAIGLMLMIGIYALYQGGNRMFKQQDANLEAVTSAAVVITVITDDLRNLTLKREDLEKTSDKHSLPISLTPGANGALEAKVTNEEPILLSKGPFKLLITDPDGIGAKKPKRDLITIEYRLKAEKTSAGKDLFQLVRKNVSTGEERIYRDGFVKDISLQFLRTKEDTKDASAPGAGDEQLFYVRVTVVGASQSLMIGANGLPSDDYYKIPIIQLYSLDCISELTTARGLGRFWRKVELKKGAGTNP